TSVRVRSDHWNNHPVRGRVTPGAVTRDRRVCSALAPYSSHTLLRRSAGTDSRNQRGSLLAASGAEMPLDETSKGIHIRASNRFGFEGSWHLARLLRRAPRSARPHLLDPRDRFPKQTLHVLERRRRIIVVIHHPMPVIPIFRPLVHDLAHELARRPPMMEPARHLDLGLLHRAVDAPRRRRRRALPIVRAVPHGIRRQELRRAIRSYTILKRAEERPDLVERRRRVVVEVDELVGPLSPRHQLDLAALDVHRALGVRHLARPYLDRARVPAPHAARDRVRSL